MELYFKLKFYGCIFTIVCVVIYLYLSISFKVCESKGIIDKIIDCEYKFKLKHILIYPAIFVFKILEKRV